ncbi:hypothetical protein [Actinoplanes sp. NPDC049265]|uniref:hypothetical protein n=1 Tax=Actinoplanes sp. NPDC049265 TaxID=3363902 RepID=UPI003722CCF4
MEHLEVEGLSRLSRTLQDVSAAMWTAPEWITGAVGDPAVDVAIRQFESGWADGRVQVQENCKTLSDLAGRALRRSEA